MLVQLRQYLQNKSINRLLLERANYKQSINIATTKSVMFIGVAKSIEEAKTLYSLTKSWSKKLGLHFDLVIITSIKKEMPTWQKNLPEIKFISTKVQFNAFGLANTKLDEALKSCNPDIAINLSLSNHKLSAYLNLLMGRLKAKLIFGADIEQHLKLHDFMIKIKSAATLEDLLSQIEFYLNHINKTSTVK